ncbi:hypothetical protein TRFO_01072 [Tritrichomonas foetus]|uniref:IPT/TIG domain-containing protein n=1 Tax=Tritrichomonas foetus TaxID=1144522 RepID=A0A1J4KIH6_9EUKA|nr:hypothetical protein TRFO_01072 [Tritrichomonas foetus]|eukprot:OHT11169.1 hypothetical protein TRFO_01072 [Tritrichomonas foetus]
MIFSLLALLSQSSIHPLDRKIIGDTTTAILSHKISNLIFDHINFRKNRISTGNNEYKRYISLENPKNTPLNSNIYRLNKKVFLTKENPINDENIFPQKEIKPDATENLHFIAQQKKFPKFEITSVFPVVLSVNGGEKIVIETNNTINGPIFCKFNDKIVPGRHTKKYRKIKCHTPKLEEGEVDLSISIDKVKWSKSVTLNAIKDEADSPWWILLLFGLSLFGVFYFLAKVFCFKRRAPKRKRVLRKNNESLNSTRKSYHRGKSPQRRKIRTDFV